jgi:hypothetical protein
LTSPAGAQEEANDFSLAFGVRSPGWYLCTVDFGPTAATLASGLFFSSMFARLLADIVSMRSLPLIPMK